MSDGVADGGVRPIAALGVAILAVSTSAILVRWSQAPSIVKALYRVVFMTAMVAPVALVRNPGAFRRIRRRDVAGAVAAGVALAVHFAAWFESLDWTSVAASVTIVQAQPLFVALGAWALLDERVSRRMLAGILVAIAGMVAMSLGDFLSGVALAGQRPLYGNALALLGAITAAGYVLAGRSLRQRTPLFPYVTVVYSVCAVVLLGVTLAQGRALLGYPLEEWALFFAMAVGPGFFGHTLINWALAHLESSVVSVSLLGEPVGSTLLALALLSEVPSTATIGGGIVVLAGIYVTASDRRGDDAPPAEAAGDD